MRMFGTFTLGFALTCTLASGLFGAPQFRNDRGRRDGQDRVCLYKDIQYQGVEQCFNASDSISTLQGLNGQVSAIRIYGRASVTVYDAPNFRGHSTVFTSSMPDLGQVKLESKSWSDRIQSLQVTVGNAPYGNTSVYRGQSEPQPNQQINEGICVYDRPNYEGRSQCWSDGERITDLARTGNWSNRISSIRVFGRTTAVVYHDAEFRGANFLVDRSIPDLARVSLAGLRSWDHQISSLRLDNSRENGFPRRSRDR